MNGVNSTVEDSALAALPNKNTTIKLESMAIIFTFTGVCILILLLILLFIGWMVCNKKRRDKPLKKVKSFYYFV